VNEATVVGSRGTYELTQDAEVGTVEAFGGNTLLNRFYAGPK
jgi:hypothetical protein